MQQFLIEVGREIGKPRCEKCAVLTDNMPDDNDEIHCDDCLQNAAEATYERHCEAYHDGGPDTDAEVIRKMRVTAHEALATASRSTAEGN
jgi:hypothetical protein